ncbi:MAG TPA: PRC-barrel domain-containing protein [Bacillales bacterium]|nr:PRC-barrel domain-containing protein [Bacillales bacterium]
MLGKDVIDKTIVHVEDDQEKAKVKDLLIRKDRPEMAYLTFDLKIPSGEIGENEDGRGALDTVRAGGGVKPATWNINQGTAPPEVTPSAGGEKRFFLIPKEQIERISSNAVVMSGTEVQEESREIDCYSYSLLKDREIETEDGETLGKIKDIVIEEREKKIIGFKLSEGFWEKLIGDGTKYMSYDGIIEWKDDKIIVKASVKDQLVDEYEQLV